MAFEAVDRRDLGDIVASELRTAILRGEFAAGDTLPSESALAMQFGVNRTTLRDAMRELEHLGLVDRRQGARARVLDWRQTGSIALLRHLIESDVGGEEFDTELVETLANVLEGFFAIAADAIVARQAPVDSLVSGLDGLEVAAGNQDLEAIEVELRELCDIYVETTESIVICLLWNTFVHILEIDLDPEMKMVHAIAADIATSDSPISILRRLVTSLGEHDRSKSQEGVGDLFAYLKSLIGIGAQLPGSQP
ncbi:MAG: hypothetical protein DCC49_08170 [Acidobacteria bacterium]|nr:MAG: hypothetical protein DCC49_08170 [Acidobacteriota bacterium]